MLPAPKLAVLDGLPEALEPQGPADEKTKPFPVRFDREIMDALRIAASLDERNMTDVVRIAVKRHLYQLGLWKPSMTPGPKKKVAARRKT